MTHDSHVTVLSVLTLWYSDEDENMLVEIKAVRLRWAQYFQLFSVSEGKEERIIVKRADRRMLVYDNIKNGETET